MRTRAWLGVICACFAARLAFYATSLPLWEGFDEWSHFAVARAVAFHGRILPSRDTVLPLDVAASLQYVPIARNLRRPPPGAVTHEGFWQLPPEERTRRAQDFQNIPAEFAAQPSNIRSNQASQPPLYYWLMAPVLRVSAGASLATQVFVMRWASALIAVPVVLLVFLVGKAVLKDDPAALACAAVAATAPELAIYTARVSNASPAVCLYGAVILLAVRRRSGWALGVLLGLGLITKTYFLAALAGVALVLWAPRAFALALAISAWWYARNLWQTGTLTGMRESVMLRGVSPWSILQDADRLPWTGGIDAILRSHLYLSGGSFLSVGDPVYHAIYLLVAAAAVGAAMLWRQPEVRSLIFIYALFWVAELYTVILNYAIYGAAMSLGWHLYAVIAAEAALAIAGLRRLLGRSGIWITAAVFVALDLYGMHRVALPHYTGTLRGNGPGLGEMFARLALFKPAFVTEGLLIALWILYLGATVALLVMSVKLARGAAGR